MKKYPVVGKNIFKALGSRPLGRHPLGFRPGGRHPLGFRPGGLVDVRSPAEYQQGHIPGAFNLPLFDDRERAAVGTTYANQGKDAAIHLGLELTGPKLTHFVQKAREIAPGGEILVHCWRGGMRSEAMAWLLNCAGMKATILPGGYKAYRRSVAELFKNDFRFIVLGGMTGCGKTELIQWLHSIGEQVIDLEKLARHKGSAFGALGQPEQPTQEQFENDLADCLEKLDPEQTIWIEDESRNIGKVIIPGAIYEAMCRSKVVLIERPFVERVNRLLMEYGHFEIRDLSEIVIKISKRIGGDVTQVALKELESGYVSGAIEVILKYYDKTYAYGLSKRPDDNISRINYEDFKNLEFSRPAP